MHEKKVSILHQFSEKSYSYVSNTPLALVDRAGLVARLYCEQIPSTRGGSWAQHLALAILEPYHCYLYVSCRGQGHHLELYGPGPDDSEHGRPHSDQPLNLSRAANPVEEPLPPLLTSWKRHHGDGCATRLNLSYEMA